MKTIAFYSYKGGVGRSLAVSNSAYYLSRQGKTVFILDMDFEAPGMHYKLEQYNTPIKPEKGIIDFLTTSRNQGKTDTALSQYTIKLESTEREMKDMWLMPAGDPMSRSYWEQMADIEWKDFLYNEEQVGVKLFWDLKHLIQEQYNPDFLLIDSRTGLTDLTGISLSLLADEVVILAVNNHENIDGSRLVMEKLQRMANSADLKMPNLHFVLTRLPVPVKGVDFKREEQITQEAKDRLNSPFVSPSDNVVIIHIDPDQALRERLRFKEENWERYPVTVDYISLVTRFAALESQHPVTRFEELFKKFQSSPPSGERNRLAIELRGIETPVPLLECVRGYLALEEPEDSEQAMQAFSHSIELNPSSEYAYLSRALVYRELKDYPSALADLDKALELDPEYALAHRNRGAVYYEMGNYSSALADCTKAIELSPRSAVAYNSRGLVFIALLEHSSALADFDKALELDPDYKQAQLNRADLLDLMQKNS